MDHRHLDESLRSPGRHLLDNRCRKTPAICAFGLSYVLNRVFNFRSHAPAGPQVAVYVVVVAVNYLAWILGVGAGLAVLGVDYRIARVAAGACEAVYMYCAMRWLVFRRR